MGSTLYYTATSIDGSIADEHNSLDWLFEVPAGDDDVGHEDRFSDPGQPLHSHDASSLGATAGLYPR